MNLLSYNCSVWSKYWAQLIMLTVLALVSDGLHDGAPGACTEAVIVKSTDRVPVSNPAITPHELGHVGQVL